MSKYHAGTHGAPICGSRRIDGFKTVVLSAKEWNKTSHESRCTKCANVIKNKKQTAEAR